MLKETLLASAMSSAMLPVVSMTKHSTEELVTPISLQDDEGHRNTGYLMLLIVGH